MYVYVYIYMYIMFIYYMILYYIELYYIVTTGNVMAARMGIEPMMILLVI